MNSYLSLGTIPEYSILSCMNHSNLFWDHNSCHKQTIRKELRIECTCNKTSTDDKGVIFVQQIRKNHQPSTLFQFNPQKSHAKRKWTPGFQKKGCISFHQLWKKTTRQFVKSCCSITKPFGPKMNGFKCSKTWHCFAWSFQSCTPAAPVFALVAWIPKGRVQISQRPPARWFSKWMADGVSCYFWKT